MKKSKQNTDKKKKRRKAIDIKKVGIWVMIIFVIYNIAIQLYNSTKPVAVDTTYTAYLEKVEAGEVERVTIYKELDYFEAIYKDGERVRVPNPRYDEFRKDIFESGVEVSMRQSTVLDVLPSVIMGVPMVIFIFAFIMYIYYSMGSIMKNYFEIVDIEDGISFDDVAGLSEIKEDVKFAVDFLKQPQLYKEAGARVPRGYMLVGPPGTGKTLIAKAIAGEAHVPFISCSGSDFVEMYVGLGAKRIRDLINYASVNAPCVVFIDEIDAIGINRNINNSGGIHETSNTLNALLQKMDGINALGGVLFVAATNRLDMLDPALIRPGRFDRIIEINPPSNAKDREEIIQVHLNHKKLGEDFDIQTASKMMKGMSGAEIEGVLNEAVIVSLMNKHEGVITFSDFDIALSKIKCKGNVKPVIYNKQLERVAIHEAGHAIAALVHDKDVKKVTIVPTTSGVGGHTLFDSYDEDDINIYSQDDLDALISILYGGLVAEKLVFGSHSTGVSNDIERATQLITSRVTTYAMCDQYVDLSKLDKQKVAAQVEQISQKVVSELTQIIAEHENELHTLADRLLKEHTVYHVTMEDLQQQHETI